MAIRLKRQGERPYGALSSCLNSPAITRPITYRLQLQLSTICHINKPFFKSHIIHTDHLVQSIKQYS